ncbi:efflux transporter outer membrane subunit [Polynucleobacter sinensis]|uniref:efflux transporter outer membrane subunit n=1 Tax=Polynucleobacter sinensis TaxID=1743157 RepID=UPI000783DDE7|nr:efflux transporter outer membrane subunit [Polynucleobacter sinensis]
MHKKRHFGICAALLIASFIVSGCARLPKIDPRVNGVDPNSFESTQSFQAPEANWPTDKWWEKYGDIQLNQLMEEALAGSPDLRIAQARLRRSESGSEAVGSILYPQITANGQVFGQELSSNYIIPPAFTPSGWNYYGQTTLNFNWEIDFWGKNRAALVAALSESQVRMAELAQAKLMLTTSIASNYADLTRLAFDKSTAERALRIRTKTFDLFKERYKQGLENIGSVNQAAGKMHLTENQLVQIEIRIAETRNRLAALAGAGPDRGLKITLPSIKQNVNFALPTDIGINLIGRRPDIVASRWQVEASESRIAQRKAAFYPNISISALAGYQSSGINRLFDPGSYISSAGPAIYLPIFLGGRLRADLNMSVAEHDETVNNYEKTLIQALNQVADIAAALKQLQTQIDLADKAAEAQKIGLSVATNRYKGGLSNYLDVLVAEDELLTSWRIQTDVRSRALSLDIALISALGGGYQTVNAPNSQ